MDRPLLVATLAVLLLAALAPAGAAADEGPADRQSLGAPPRTSGGEGLDPLVLPPSPDATGGDPGRTDWATSDAATLRREAHLRRVTAAYGAAGTFAGLAGTSLLIGFNQPDPGHRRAWYTGGAVLGGLSGVALVTGTVLWATTPPAPGRPRLAAGPGAGLALTLDFY
jgi:hypothetical protein